jgi:hypothetical protein
MLDIQVFRLGEEPIIQVVLKGHLTVDGAAEVYRQVGELRKDMPKYIYRITDVSEVETSFTDMMQILKQASVRGNSTAMDPTVTVVYVGTTHWLKLFTDALRQGMFGSKELPVFLTVDEALSYVREKIASAEQA